MFRLMLLAVSLLACLALPVAADTSPDMGQPSPHPPRPMPVREKNKKPVSDGQDQSNADDSKTKKPPKESGGSKRVDK